MVLLLGEPIILKIEFQSSPVRTSFLQRNCLVFCTFSPFRPGIMVGIFSRVLIGFVNFRFMYIDFQTTFLNYHITTFRYSNVLQRSRTIISLRSDVRKYIPAFLNHHITTFRCSVKIPSFKRNNKKTHLT